MYFAILSLFLLVGCGHGVTFNPDFYVPSVEEQALVNENGSRVFFLSSDVEKFACMSEGKIKELKELLMSVRRVRATSKNAKSGKARVSEAEDHLAHALTLIEIEK